MKEFIIDTHVHTKEGSACSDAPASEMVRYYKDNGFDAIIVTNHFLHGNSSVSTSLPWEDYVNGVCEGYENAKSEGDKIGLKVFFGLEVGFGQPEFLVYGLPKEYYLKKTDMLSWDIVRCLKELRAAGGFIIQAHPFRQHTEIKLYPGLTDGAEEFNLGNRYREGDFDAKAKWYIDSYSLCATSGSDRHRTDYPKFAGMAFDRELESIEDFITAVKNKECKRLIKDETIKGEDNK